MQEEAHADVHHPGEPDGEGEGFLETETLRAFTVDESEDIMADLEE